MTNSLRNKTSRTAYLASLRNKVQEMSSPKGASQRQDDDRYWKPEVDKAGIGSAIIRFLPAKVGEEFPFVQLWSHGFQGPNGKWYIENCPTSIGNDCPACQSNSELWNASNDKEDPLKKLASSRKRKLSYISNILVVTDPKHPENNGKVFLFKYGKKIFEKIKDMIDPPKEFADMQPVDPFDMTEGANFKLRITRQDNFPNYDKSSFDPSTPIGDEAFMEQIDSQLMSLNEILDPKHFKEYSALTKRLSQVIGESSVPDSTTDDKPPFDVDDDMPVAHPKQRAQAAPVAAPKTAPPQAAAAAPRVAPKAAPEEEDFFSQLAQQADND